MGLSASPGFMQGKYAWLKLLLITAIVLLNGYAIVLMYAGGEYAFALLTLVVVSTGVYVFLSKKMYAHRYIFPGIAGMVVFIIFPLAYTIGIAFTNYSGTNLLSLERVEQLHTQKTYMAKGGSFNFQLHQESEGKYVLALSQDDKLFVTRPVEVVSNADVRARKLTLKTKRIKLHEVDALPATDKAPIKEIISHRQFFNSILLVTPEEHELVMNGLRKFSAMKPLFTRLEDGVVLKESGAILPGPSILRNNQTGELMLPNMETGFYQYIDGDGQFVGSRLAPGFTVSVGWKNFERVATDKGIKEPFIEIFIWTVIFASASVAFTLAIGMVLACLIQWEELKGRAIYRVVLILPYAIPAFISILVFKGLFNQNFGEINEILNGLFGIKPDWFTDPVMAKSMILIVNTWLGYPYMMILCLGMLKSIPEDLYEASAMDGAGPINNFFNITVPLLMKPLTPLLVASFAFNFNNFVLIQLLTNGGPDIIGASTPAGTTDLLVSYTYRIAFQGDGGQDYGLASAIATLIFLVVGALALINLKLTKADKAA
ncbi:maltose ABC transporter permease MalF [Agarivorans sp. Alg241-V36]|uniref:maltose ABC transporter permease MalF n=1 Tax=Agarivorans sp. Alg241-V36 TaxID=2305992 RepID=UPI0013D78D45|nr:maltose ABC transporter permease MalF [Agarivorans sp. Alg241-V36]